MKWKAEFGKNRYGIYSLAFSALAALCTAYYYGALYLGGSIPSGTINAVYSLAVCVFFFSAAGFFLFPMIAIALGIISLKKGEKRIFPAIGITVGALILLVSRMMLQFGIMALFSPFFVGALSYFLLGKACGRAGKTLKFFKSGIIAKILLYPFVLLGTATAFNLFLVLIQIILMGSIAQGTAYWGTTPEQVLPSMAFFFLLATFYLLITSPLFSFIFFISSRVVRFAGKQSGKIKKHELTATIALGTLLSALPALFFALLSVYYAEFIMLAAGGIGFT